MRRLAYLVKASATSIFASLCTALGDVDCTTDSQTLICGAVSKVNIVFMLVDGWLVFERSWGGMTDTFSMLTE